jgi:phospholipid-transporting ATPase
MLGAFITRSSHILLMLFILEPLLKSFILHRRARDEVARQLSQAFQSVSDQEFRTVKDRILNCKGDNTVILERLGKHQLFTEKTLAHLEVGTSSLFPYGGQDYATDGLRTLCIAYRDISPAEWATIHAQAAATINGRGKALDQAAELIEKDIFFLGATAIEDKLQDGVPDAIHTLQEAGIKIWVLTGDRQETGINIGMSMHLVVVNEETARETAEFIEKRLGAIRNQRSSVFSQVAGDG